MAHLGELELQQTKAKVLEKVLVLPFDMHGLLEIEYRIWSAPQKGVQL